MKTKIFTHEFPKDWDSLSPIQQRMAAINHNGQYWASFITISDENDKWYVGLYHILPFINFESGKIYFKSICRNSATFKNGKFYGSMSPFEMLFHLCERVPKFEFAKSIADSSIIRMLPEYAIAAILTGRVTSQEDIWKLISKRSYHNAHWKLVKQCKTEGISFAQLKLACRDWEAFDAGRVGDRYQLRNLISTAIILGEKISCRWSEKRQSEELTRMSRMIDEIRIASLPIDPAYSCNIDLPEGWQMVNTERDAHKVSSFFDNCVRSYWNRIRRYEYLVFYNTTKEICIGYHIINSGEDVLFDQIHGKHNSGIPTEIFHDVNTMLRPIAEKLAQYSHQFAKIEENNDYLLAF